MKKFYGIILLFTALTAFKTNLQAQVCASVTAEVIFPNPQSGQYNYFGAKVSIAEGFGQEIPIYQRRCL